MVGGFGGNHQEGGGLGGLKVTWQAKTLETLFAGSDQMFTGSSMG